MVEGRYVCGSECYVVSYECDSPHPRGATEAACSMAVRAMSTRPWTSVLRMPSTHPAIRTVTSIIGRNTLDSCP